MALNTQIADATVNAQAAALATLCNSGLIKIYDGTQPATADTALGAQVLGVTLTFGATAFPAANSGLLTAEQEPKASFQAMSKLRSAIFRM